MQIKLVVTTALACLWWNQVNPDDVQKILTPPAWLAATALGTIAFLGLSGLAIAVAYAAAWKWILDKLMQIYLMPEPKQTRSHIA